MISPEKDNNDGERKLHLDLGPAVTAPPSHELEWFWGDSTPYGGGASYYLEPAPLSPEDKPDCFPPADRLPIRSSHQRSPSPQTNIRQSFFFTSGPYLLCHFSNWSSFHIKYLKTNNPVTFYLKAYLMFSVS